VADATFAGLIRASPLPKQFQESQFVQSSPLPRPTPFVTYTLIAICVSMYVLTVSAPDLPLGMAALWPLGENFAPWQIFTYAFLHASPSHLLFNMIGVYMFGGELERLLGASRFAVLYFAGVLTAALAQLAFGAYTDSLNPTIGASGGLFGLLLAYAMIFPKRKILLLIPPIPMPAWLFVTLYASAELYFGVTGTLEGIAHFAHLGGLVGGFLVLTHWRLQYERKHGRS
jgi:membrane associated rhomboid family serine protease